MIAHRLVHEGDRVALIARAEVALKLRNAQAGCAAVAQNERKFRDTVSANAMTVVAHAASAIQIMGSESDLSGGKSSASESLRLAMAYMPSGKTKLHNMGV